MKFYLYIIILVTIATTTSSFAQFNFFNVGGGVGLGSINGNFPSQSSFDVKFTLETEPFIEPFNSLQFNFIFAQKIERILPENRTNKYYPFIKSFSITANKKQNLNDYLFVGEGLGLLLLNDRTFDIVNTWNLGFVINFLVGTNITNKINLSFNLDYGLTLNNTNTSFLLFTLQTKYLL